MNEDMVKATKLLREHQRGEAMRNELQRKAAPLKAQLEEIDADLRTIELRQDEIADALAPVLANGPIEWWDGKVKCVVRLDGEDCLTIEPLNPPHTLAFPVKTRPRAFTNAELREAARYAVFTDTDDDDTTEIISLPGRCVTIAGNNAG